MGMNLYSVEPASLSSFAENANCLIISWISSTESARQIKLGSNIEGMGDAETGGSPSIFAKHFYPATLSCALILYRISERTRKGCH
jgi:hypothetical protein